MDNFRDQPKEVRKQLRVRSVPAPAIEHVNVLIRGFNGLCIGDKTLNLVVPQHTTIARLVADIRARITHGPKNVFRRIFSHLRIQTACRTQLESTSQRTVGSLIDASGAPILNLNLSYPIRGGKGGFGSQLRAAGGRMSSRKNRRNETAEQQNGSNRNLDGRRLRTITEAKNLANYLAIKPEMDKKEKEERRKRWQQVVETAERKEDEIRRGRGAGAKIDGEWIEQKEEAESKTREAVMAAMKAGLIGNEAVAAMLERTGSESSSSGEERDSDDHMDGEASSSSASGHEDEGVTAAAEISKPAPAAPAAKTFYGWDEDDEFMSDEDDEDDQPEESAVPVTYEGKGKGKA